MIIKAQRVKRSIGVNALLNVIKQVLSILFPMITVYTATRALGTDNFGMVNYIKSIVSYFILLSGLGISTYAIREGAKCRDDRKQFNMFANQVFTINAFSTIISSFLLLIFLFITKITPSTKEFAIYLVFGTTMFLSFLGADWINSIYEDFFYLTVRYIFIYGIALFCLFLFVRTPETYLIYAILTVIATSGGNVLNILYIRKYAKLRLVPLSECKQHIHPIFILFSSTIASTIYISSDTTILGAIAGNNAVAIYTVASQIYIAIKHMTNAAVSVAIPRLSYFVGNEDVERFNALVTKIVNYALLFVCPCVVGLFELSDSAMVFMGDNDYLVGSVSLKILSVALFFAVLAYILSRCILIPSKKDKVYLIATIISALINIGLNFFFVPKLLYTGAAITTLISEIIVFAIFCVYSHRIIHIQIPWRDFIKSICGCFFIVIACQIIKTFELNLIMTIVLSVIVSVFAYVAMVLILRHEIALEIMKKMKNKVCKIKK